MEKPKIISVGFSVPLKSYTQREVFDSLGYPRHFWSIFVNSAIDKRHLWIPLGKPLTWQEACDEYDKGAKVLSKQAIINCLDGRSAKEIGCVAFSSCTGYRCPSVMHEIADEIGFSSNVLYVNILGMGCEGGAPALRRAYDYSALTHQPSLAIACELCSTCYFPEPNGIDPSGDYELLRSNAIFGDGASCVLIGFDDDPKHPYLVDFENHFDPAYMHHLGFVWQDGRLRNKMSRKIPQVAPLVIRPPLEAILRRNNLALDDITWWVVHPGGSAVLSNVRDQLGIPEEKLTLSREVLRQYGNTSSVGIGIIGKLLARQDVKSGDWGVIISLGAGLAAGVALIRWEK